MSGKATVQSPESWGTRTKLGSKIWPRRGTETNLYGLDGPIIDVATRYGLDLTGASDMQPNIQAAIDEAPAGAKLYFPTQGTVRLDSGLSISGKSGLEFHLAKRHNWLFTDGSYTGVTFTGASDRCKFSGGMLFGTNHSTPSIVLMRVIGLAANFEIVHTEFAYSFVDLLFGNTYICKALGTKHSNSNTYIKTDQTIGSMADISIERATFGTSAIGSNPHVEINSPTTFLSGYWETQTRSKISLLVKTGSQQFRGECHLFDSGSVEVQASVSATLSMISQNSYCSNRCLNIDASGAVLLESGSRLGLDAVIASVIGIRAVGFLSCVGATVNKFDTGLSLSSTAVVSASTITSCGTQGVLLNSGTTARIGHDNYMAGNAVDITNNAAATATVFSAPATTHGTFLKSTTVAASQSASNLGDGAQRFLAPHPGYVNALAVKMEAARTAGTCTVTVYKNTGVAGAAGSAMSIQAVIDGTNTTSKVTSGTASLTFNAGDELYCRFDTDASWTPTANGIHACIELCMRPS